MVNIAFAGHRPNKLYGYNTYSKKYEPLRDKILEVLDYITEKYDLINRAYNGLALGFDKIAFEEIYFSENYDCRIIGCIPFRGQEKEWRATDIEIYELMKQKSSELVYVDTLKEYKVRGYKESEYSPIKMLRRNEYMVDNAKVLVSCWNGIKNGGTWDCIKYALKKDNILEIININPTTLEIEFLKQWS